MAKKNNITRIPTETIELIVYDFDGVMTDNRAIIFQDGTEAVIVNRADGLGIDHLRTLDIAQLILSTETNPVVKARASKLRVEAIIGCGDKKKALLNYCKQNNCNLENTVYLGNDLNDLEVMKVVGFPIATADAHSDIKTVAKFITKSKGGEGVVRELAEILEKSVKKPKRGGL